MTDYKIGDLVLNPIGEKCKIVYILRSDYAMLVYIGTNGREGNTSGCHFDELKHYIEPKKQVMRWPALRLRAGIYFASNRLFKDEKELEEYHEDGFIRLLKEWPGVLCDE
jgi:hypothetical protein